MKRKRIEKHSPKKLASVLTLIRIKRKVPLTVLAKDPKNPSDYIFSPSYASKILNGKCKPSRKLKVENGLARALGFESWAQIK